MNNTRIKLQERLYPVESYFNWLGAEEFLTALKKFSEGLGYFSEDHTCHFPADQVEEEGGSLEDYPYIEFWTYSNNEDVRITFAEFLDILKKVSEKEAMAQPNRAEEIGNLFEEIENYLTSI